QLISRAVDMRLERNTLLGELPQLGQRHDLEAAAVGENRSLPVHEIMQPPQYRNAFRARPQHQVIGIAKQDVRACLPNLFGIHGLDGAGRAHRHEGGRVDLAAWRIDAATTGCAIRGEKGEVDLFHGAGSSLPARTRQLARHPIAPMAAMPRWNAPTKMAMAAPSPMTVATRPTITPTPSRF